MSELIGQEIAGFRILREIARGGMGVVFEAEQMRLGRPVALKMLYPALTVDENFLRRFRNEARTLARLNHENIVNVLDFFDHDGRHFLALEFVEGETLGRRLRRCAKRQRFFSLGEASMLVWQVAQALEFAHGRSIIHRDLKPDNVMLTPRGRAKVMDFGIAKILGASGKTEAGTRVGTPDYMAPEQLRGQTADERSDLFALGLIYYELMAGHRPYSQTDLLRAEHGELCELPWDESALPPGSVRARPLFDRLLALDREQRFASATEVLDEMRQCLGPEVLGEAIYYPVSPPPPGEGPEVEEPVTESMLRPRAWRWWLAAAGVLAGLLVGVFVSNRLQNARFTQQERRNEAVQANFEAFMADTQNRETEAETLFLRAITLEPSVARFWRDLGDFYYKHNKLRSAIPYYKKTLELDPGDGETARRLRDAQAQLGQTGG